MIVSPIVLIALVLMLRTGDAPPEPRPVEDPNARIKELEGQVNGFVQSFRECMKLAQAEDPAVGPKREKLVAALARWIDEWDTIIEPHRDGDGRLPPELQGYGKTRTRVNNIRLDVMKSTGF